MFFDFRYHMYKLSFTHIQTRTHTASLSLSFFLCCSQFYTLNNRSILVYESFILSHVQSIYDVLHKLLTKTVFFLVPASTRKSLSTNFNIKCMPMAKLLNIYTNALVFVSQ